MITSKSINNQPITNNQPSMLPVDPLPPVTAVDAYIEDLESENKDITVLERIIIARLEIDSPTEEATKTEDELIAIAAEALYDLENGNFK